MRDKHQITEEPCDGKASSTVLESSGSRARESLTLIISEWLLGMGLELKPSKTRLRGCLKRGVKPCVEGICWRLGGLVDGLTPLLKHVLTHTLNRCGQEEPGFNFLGFNIRQFRVDKYHSKQGFKTIITPNRDKRKVHYDQIALVIEAHKSAPQAALIANLNPIIRGWANYYATVVSKVAYSDLDHLTYQKLRGCLKRGVKPCVEGICWRLGGLVDGLTPLLKHVLRAWAKRRHPKKNGEWVSKKYWQSIRDDNWVFATRQEGKNPLRLLDHADTPIVRHVKVKGESSPYDGNLVYWSTRMGNHPEMPKRVAILLKKQKGKCTHCRLFFREEDVMEVDHKIPKSKGGKDSYDNWQLLHRHCHDTKTALNSSSGSKSGCNSAEPKPTKRLVRVKDNWVMRYA